MASFGLADRVRAGAVHLMLSTLVLLVVYALVVFFWYPEQYLGSQGVVFLLLVLTAVHLLVGPLLTFLVYRKGKKGLKFDLWIIVLLQLTALAYGANVIYQERPYFMVFALDRFNVLASGDVDMNAVAAAGFDAKPWRGPSTLISYMPMGDEFQRFQDSVMFEGQPDLERRPEYWGAYPEPALPVQAVAQSLDALAAARSGQRPALEAAVAKTGLAWEQLAFVPIKGKKRDFAALVDTQNHQLLGIAPVDPWIND